MTEAPTLPAPSFYSSFALNHQFPPPFGAGAGAPQTQGVHELLSPHRAATPSLWHGAEHREHFKGSGTVPGSQGCSLPQHPGGKVSPSRLPGLIRLPRHRFRLPKLRQGGKICFLATPPMPGSKKHPLNPGWGRNGRSDTAQLPARGEGTAGAAPGGAEGAQSAQGTWSRCFHSLHPL